MSREPAIPRGSTVAVTGATGFVGQHLCQQLLADGYQVRALARSPSNAQSLAATGVQLIAGDLENTTALAQLLDGSSAVIHCAGAVRGNAQLDFDHVNVDGTVNILRALAKHASGSRLLHLSSLAAREPELSYYSRSKRRGEELVQSEPGLDWVVLRPPAVYGPGDKEMLPLFQAMARGFLTVPGSADARTSLIHVDDLVTAIIACLESGATNGKLYELGDGTQGGYSWREMASIAGQVFHRPVRVLPVPAWLLNGIAAANSVSARLSGRAPMLTPPKLRELRHPDWVTDTTAITAATDWQPTIELRQGLQQLDIQGD